MHELKLLYRVFLGLFVPLFLLNSGKTRQVGQYQLSLGIDFNFRQSVIPFYMAARIITGNPCVFTAFGLPAITIKWL